MEEARSKVQKKGAASRTRSIAFVGLSIAIMAVSAWVTVPLGPVPFTLQMFAFAFLVLHALRGRFEGDGKVSVVKGLVLDVAVCLVFLCVVYVCGWAQFMAVTGTDPMAAFMTTIAPFVVVDVLKMVAAAICARAVRTAVPQR